MTTNAGAVPTSQKPTGAKSLLAAIDRAAAGDNPEGPDGLWMFISNDPANVVAERLAVEFSRWIAERSAEVPAFEKQIRDYAAKYFLEHLLPPDMVI